MCIGIGGKKWETKTSETPMDCTQTKPITMVTKATIRHMINHLPFRSGWSSWKEGKFLKSMGWMGFVIPLGTSSLVRNSQTTNENWPICPRLKLNHVFLWIIVGSCQTCMMAWNQVYFSEAIWNDFTWWSHGLPTFVRGPIHHFSLEFLQKLWSQSSPQTILNKSSLAYLQIRKNWHFPLCVLEWEPLFYTWSSAFFQAHDKTKHPIVSSFHDQRDMWIVASCK